MIVGRHERVLAIDGDYIHVGPISLNSSYQAYMLFLCRSCLPLQKRSLTA